MLISLSVNKNKNKKKTIRERERAREKDKRLKTIRWKIKKSINEFLPPVSKL